MHRENLQRYLYGLFFPICVMCLFAVFPLVAEGASTPASLAGTWRFNRFAAGPGAPCYWDRGTVTVSANETFTYAGMDIYNNVNIESGAFSFSSNGIVMTISDDFAPALCQIDSSNSVLVCTETGWDYYASPVSLLIFTKVAASYSMPAGNWNGNFLFAGTTSVWQMVNETFTSSGTFTGAPTANSPGSSISGKVSFSLTGIMTCVSGTCLDPPNYESFMDAGKTVLVGTSGDSEGNEGAFSVLTSQAASYSEADLAGSWQGNTVAAGDSAPWWQRDSLTIYPDGSSEDSWTASDGSTGSATGTFTIVPNGSSAGAITWNCADCNENTSFSGFMDSGKTVMVFSDTWASDPGTQEIKVFTKDGAPNAPTAVTAAAGIGQAAVSFTGPVSNGSPIISYTVTSTPGGIQATGSGSPIVVRDLTNGTAYTFTVKATNASGASPASSASNSVTPFAVPPTSVSQLAGTWNFSAFATGPDAPWWNRMTLTVEQDGTFTYFETQNDGSSDTGSGAFWIPPGGIFMTTGQPNNMLCQIDSDKTVIACTETWQGSSTKLTIGTKQAASYSLADLYDGPWQFNSIGAPSYEAETAAVTFDSSGDYSGYLFQIGNPTRTVINTSGTLSISSGGVIACDSGDCSSLANANYGGFIDASKALGVLTSGGSSSSDAAWLFLLTNQAASYSIADLAGTWQGNKLNSGYGNGYWERDTVTISTTGTATESYNGSDGSSGTGSAIGTLSISSTGVVTCASGSCADSDWQGYMDAAKTVWVSLGTNNGSPYIEIFTKNTAIVPEAPTAVTAVPGNAQAVVSFSPPCLNGGSAITSYIVTASPGGKTVSGTGASMTVTGLTNGTAYTFTVQAKNAVGTGPASLPSNSVTPAGPPGAPTSVTATAGTEQAIVSFTPPASNGGSAITGYTVTSTPGGIQATGTGNQTQITVPGLTSDTAYTFTVTATNAAGYTGPASSHSNSITPAGIGMLTVTITPAAAVTAGAQWSLDGNTWYASGAKVSLPDTGSPYTVSFKNIAGWTTPPTSLPLTITQGQTTSGQGLYVQQTGSLEVTIGPAAALTAGAKWSINGTTWNASGAVVSNTPAGSYTVTFKPVTGWNTAASVQNVIITDADTPATATGTYTQPVMTFTVPSSLGTVLQCSNSLDYLLNADVAPTGTYTYRMGTGSPPAGITVNSSGAVSGQPSSAANTYSFNVCVDDADGGELCKPTSIKVTALTPGAPSGPSPASSATGVSISPTLTWAPISTATSYDVYFGTSSTPPKVMSGTTTTTYTPPGVLNTKTTYHWQVVANNSMCGTLSPTVTKGPVWSFTTGATAVTGTAAAGGPITGAAVTLVDSAGNTASGTTSSAGSFSIHSDGLTPPFLLSVTTGETTYYSVSENLNETTTINITPLTDMIVRAWYGAQNPPVDVATAFGNPGTYPAPPPIAVSAISPVVTGIVQPWLKLAGVNPVTFDPISTPFTATNGTGIAQVLEQTSETINSGNIAVAISNSAITQNTTMTSSATEGSVTCSTTYTTSGQTTNPVIAVSYVPITSAQQTALTGINTTVSQLVATVKTRGANLEASDIAPYVSSSFLNNGLSATQWETNAATSLAGASVSSGLLVNSLDTVNNVADISFAISTTKNGATSTSTLETTFTLVSGSWLISGNGQIASAYAQTWAWDNSSGYTKGLRFTVDDPQGVVTAVTVSGPGITGSTTVPQVCGGSTGVSCGNAFGGYDTQSAFQIDVTNSPPTILSPYTFTLTPSTAPPSYNSTVNAAFGFNASANPVSADYPSLTFINGGAPSLAEIMSGSTLHGSVYIPIWVTSTPQAPQFNYEGPSQSNNVSGQLIQGTWDSGTAIPGQLNNFTIVIPAAEINSVSDCNGGSGVCYNITFQGQTGDITGGWFGEDACYSGGRDEPTSCTNSGIEIQQ